MGLFSRLGERSRAVDNDQLFALVARMYKEFLSAVVRPVLESPPRAYSSDDPQVAYFRDNDMLLASVALESDDPAVALGNAIVFTHNQVMLYATDTEVLTYQRRKPTVWDYTTSADRTYVSKSLFPHCLQAFRKHLREGGGPDLGDGLDALVDLPGVTEAPYGPQMHCVNGLWFVKH